MSWQLAYVLALLFSAAVGLVLSRQIARSLVKDKWSVGGSLPAEAAGSGLAAPLPPGKVLGLALLGIVAGVGSTWYAATLLMQAGPATDAPEITATNTVEVRGTSFVQRDVRISYRPKIAVRTDMRLEAAVTDAGDGGKLQRVWFLSGSVDLKRRAGTRCTADKSTAEETYSCASPGGNDAMFAWYVSADVAGGYELTIGPKEARPLDGVLTVNGQPGGPDASQGPRVKAAEGTIILPLTITESSGLTQWQERMMVLGGVTAGAILGPGFLWVLPWFRRFKKPEEGQAQD